MRDFGLYNCQLYLGLTSASTSAFGRPTVCASAWSCRFVLETQTSSRSISVSAPDVCEVVETGDAGTAVVVKVISDVLRAIEARTRPLFNKRSRTTIARALPRDAAHADPRVSDDAPTPERAIASAAHEPTPPSPTTATCAARSRAAAGAP